MQQMEDVLQPAHFPEAGRLYRDPEVLRKTLNDVGVALPPFGGDLERAAMMQVLKHH